MNHTLHDAPVVVLTCARRSCGAAILACASFFGSVALGQASPEPRWPVDLTGLPLDVSRETLERSAMEQRAALMKLNSWRGRLNMKERFSVPFVQSAVGNDARRRELKTDEEGIATAAGPFRVLRESSVEFVWSRDLRSYASKVVPSGPDVYTHVPLGKSTTVDSVAEVRTLVRPDGLYIFHPTEVAGNFEGFPNSTPIVSPRTRYVTRDPTEDAKRMRTHSIVFDPSVAFELGGRRVDEFLSKYGEAKTWIKLKLPILVARGRDGHVYFEKAFETSGSEEVEVVRCQFDPDYNCLPVWSETVNSDGRRTSSAEWQYRRAADVIWPIVFRRTEYDSNGEVTYERECKVVESEVKPSMNEEQFRFSALGVEDGDRLVDRVEKRIAVFEGGSPVEVPRVVRARRSTLFIVLLVNGVGIAFVAILLLQRWRRRVR